MDPLPYITGAIRHLRRLEIEEVENIPSQGPALIAPSHNSPMDLFYYLALMQSTGREDHRVVIAGELVDKERFRSYTRAALRDSIPRLGAYLGFLVDALSFLVPPLVRKVNPIPISRNGDDSDTRRWSLDCLLIGQLLTIAPERGNESKRDSDGLRPLTYGVASIARRYFDATGEPLAVIPVALGVRRPHILSKVRVRIGKPFLGMSDQQYPNLFSNSGREDDTVKYAAYQHFTKQLTSRLSELTKNHY
jgi:1-acyl-sn-glycerol-3-phosphate acyltransferase